MELKNKRVLVTGGAGFIGSHLVDELVKKDCLEVIVLDNLFTGKKERLNKDKRVKFFKKDISSSDSIKYYFEDINIVFHTVAMARIQPSFNIPKEYEKTNVIGTLNVLEASHHALVKKIIYSGSSSVYGDQNALPLIENMTPRPKNPYAFTKLGGEYYCKMFSEHKELSTVILRYFNVYGPRQPENPDDAYSTVIGIFLKQKREGKSLTIVPDGNQRRDFTHVYDVVGANVMAAESDNVGSAEIINIGFGRNYSVLELAALIHGKARADLVLGNDYVWAKPRKGESRETLADISRAKQLLGWEPKIELEKGLGMC